MDPYNQISNKINKIKADDGITPKNKLLLEKFRDYCLANSLSVRRILKYLHYLSVHAKILGKDFDSATKEDIQLLVAEIEKKEWAEWTKYDNKMMIKTFYKWLEGDGEAFPKKVAWLKAKVKSNRLI
ncbi:MAG: hypothetical protein QXN71_03405, partial [Candidatus Aenigmatarchaeota archaeon]